MELKLTAEVHSAGYEIVTEVVPVTDAKTKMIRNKIKNLDNPSSDSVLMQFIKPKEVSTTVQKSKSGKSELRKHKSSVNYHRDIEGNVFEKFIEILRPFSDHVIYKERPKNWLFLIDLNDPDYDEEVTLQFAKAVLKFVNEYGLSQKRGFEIMRYQHKLLCESDVYPEDKFIHFIENNNLANSLMRYLMEAQCLQDALNMRTEFHKTLDGSAEVIEQKLKDHQISLEYTRGFFSIFATDAMSAVWLTYALKLNDIEPVPCLYCGVPVFHRKGAKFCRPNKKRNCKDGYHNQLKRKKTIERKKLTTTEEEEFLKSKIEAATRDYLEFTKREDKEYQAMLSGEITFKEWVKKEKEWIKKEKKKK